MGQVQIATINITGGPRLPNKIDLFIMGPLIYLLCASSKGQQGGARGKPLHYRPSHLRWWIFTLAAAEFKEPATFHHACVFPQALGLKPSFAQITRKRPFIFFFF